MNNVIIKTLFCVSLTGISVSSSAYTLVAECDGPGGYCTPGANIKISYLGGADVIIPKKAFNPIKHTLALAYVNLSDQTSTGWTMLRPEVTMNPSVYGGGTAWGTLTNLVTGTFKLPATSLKQGDYCVGAFLNTYINDVDHGYPWLPYGSNNWVSNGSAQQLCVAKAPPPPPDEACYLNYGSAISVDFGSVERGTIDSAPSGSLTQKKGVSVYCPGALTHHINLKLSMTPTAWATNQIKTSNPALGVQVSSGDKILSSNESVNLTVTGSGNADFSFSLLRDPSKKGTDISTGKFTSSAAIIVSEP